jgi:hypothetical protein
MNCATTHARCQHHTLLNLCKFKVGLGIGIAAGLPGGSPGTLSNKKSVLVSELQGEHNSVLLVDESSESEKVNIWRTLGSLECLVEVTFSVSNVSSVSFNQCGKAYEIYTGSCILHIRRSCH